MKTPSWEATKRILRPVAFAGIFAFIEGILQWLKIAKIDASTITLLTAIFTWLDSYVHEKAKLENVVKTVEGKSFGILPF